MLVCECTTEGYCTGMAIVLLLLHMCFSLSFIYFVNQIKTHIHAHKCESAGREFGLTSETSNEC